MGRLAKADLRRAKMEAHKHFDSLWRGRGWRRGQAYRWLAQKLGLPADSCHIGMFDVATCERVVSICREQA
jgi:hypothetical protein